MRLRSCVIGVALISSSASFALAQTSRRSQAADGVALLPATFELSGRAAKQTVIVELLVNGQLRGQIRDRLAMTSSNEKVVIISDSVAYPVADGSATLTARVGNRAATAQVSVVGMSKPFAWSFRNHVQSVLTKQGCNSGACHGAIAGKNGFRLSLRGFNAEGDHDVLTRQVRGRRVNVQEPGRSLMLLKPTTAVTHGGGKRLAIGSPEYQVISEWIAAGAPAPSANDPRIARVELVPGGVIVEPQAKQQLLVRATFSDGHTEDVTRWSKYSVANAEVGQVDDYGLLTLVGCGETAVTAWYLNQLAVGTVTVPYAQTTPEAVFAQASRKNFIDDLVLEKLRALNLPATTECTDQEFIRRAFIDAIGTLPTADEVRGFLADQSADKRDRLIERLLERPEFVDYWTYRWSDLLLVNSDKLRPPAMWSYYHWIRNRVAANTAWDVIVRDLLTAQGSTLENGAANFFVLHQDPMELMETMSTAFMGMPITCARCHNHPLEKWTNDQYFGMLGLVARVRQKNGVGVGNVSVYASPTGDIVQPLSGKVRPPQPLDGSPMAAADPTDRRLMLADWLTTPDNPYFTRAIANRVWANFLGVGLVEKVDDLRLTNPASNEKLLTALAKHLVDKKYNLKALMRTILQSATYQRSSVPLPENKDDRRFYSRYYPRRLMAEVLLDGISQVTEAPTQFAGYPAGWRSLQLPDSNVASYFLEKFGRPERQITCDCERNSEPSMVQVLHLSNGDVLNKKLAAKGNRIDRALAAKRTPEQLLEDAYLAALARRPTDAERERFRTELGKLKPEEMRACLEDAFWGILSSKEFLFNH